ncbi:MAG: hypothetical protein JST90_13130 [Bacteroidetes bacterium]|nr:hypothetical protein [Bacteroidota bacterium]
MNKQLPSHPCKPLSRAVYLRREKALMMGKLSKFILFFYVLSLLRPAVPMVADFVAHTFYEQEHIMMVHEVKGKFHIHDEIGKKLSHNEQEKGNITSVDMVEYCHAAIVHLPPIPAIRSSRIHITAISFCPCYQLDILSPPPCA